MTSFHKSATLNINGIVVPQLSLKLKESHCAQDIDFIFLQEVTIPVFPPFAGCRTYVHVSTTHRRTAVIIRCRMWLDKVDMLPWRGGGRGELQPGVALYIGLISTGYSEPQGEKKVLQRRSILHSAYILRNFIIGGDFNCILGPLDKIDAINSSRVLDSS